MAEASTADASQLPESADVDALTNAIEMQPNSEQLPSLKQIIARLRAESTAAAEPPQNSPNPALARKLVDAGRALWNKAKAMFREADDAVHCELECMLRSAAQEIMMSAMLVDPSVNAKAFFVRCAETSEAWMDLVQNITRDTAGKGDKLGDDETSGFAETVQKCCANAEASLSLRDVVLSTRNDSDDSGALVDVLLARSRIKFVQGDRAESLREIELAREKIETAQPDKAEDLVARAFDFGRQRVEHSDSIPWFELSIDVQQKSRLINHTESEISNQRLSTTYLMLAHCFLREQRYGACEVAANKAEDISKSVASASLLLQCNVAQGNILDAKGNLDALISHPEISGNVPLACHSLKVAAGAKLDTEPSVRVLLANPMIAPQDKLLVRIFRLEAVLGGEATNSQSISAICEDIRQHHTNDPVLAKPDNTITTALLEHIDSTMQRWGNEAINEAAMQAIDDTCLCCEELLKFDFITPEQDTCIARILCYAKLRKDDLVGSDQYLQKVLAADPSSLVTQVLHWKFSVQSKQSSVSKDVLRRIVQIENDDKHSLLISMAQTALEYGQHEINLQCLQEQFHLESVQTQERVALLVDMVRIGETLGTSASINVMRSLTDADMKMVKSEADETSLQYIHNTIWNLGVKAARTSEFQACSEFFLRCASLCSVEQPEGLKRTKLLLMLGADALVLHTKQQWHPSKVEDKQDIIAKIERALTCIKRCRHLMVHPSPAETGSDAKQDSGLPHLSVMECRARCLLIDVTNTDDVDSLNAVLHAAEELPSFPQECFVQIYDILSTATVQHPELACRAIKCALGLSLENQSKAAGMLPQAYDESAILIRQLIEATKKAKQIDECLAVVNTARDHVAKSEGGYPAIEIEWLVCTSWNEGVRLANDGNCTAADPWMSAAVGMLEFLPSSTFSDKKRKQMQAELSDVLRKRES